VSEGAAKRIGELFAGELRVINMGLESFAESLQREGAPVLQMGWRPPAGGDERLMGLLRRLGR
jgi:hypothetical protein